MNENPNPNSNQGIVPVMNSGEVQNIQNEQSQRGKLAILNQTEYNVNVSAINNGQGQQIQMSYEVNEKVMFFAGGKSLIKNNKEKAKPNQYNSVDVDDPELFDGTIKCARLKCVVFGIITGFLNTIRLFYLIFLHLGYPAIIWLVRCICAIVLFCIILCRDDPETIQIEPESGLERIDYERGKFATACSLCVNSVKALGKCVVNFVFCPCWFYHLVVDCIYDIKNRALDNARTGCYKFIHYDFGIYEKVVEDPFNNYMKKRHIILTTNPQDPDVIYGDACKDNTII